MSRRSPWRRTIASFHWAFDVFMVLYQVRYALVILLIMTLIGAAGYMVLLDVGWIEGLYQSVITLSTVGHMEVRPFDQRAQLFTIFLIFIGVGTVFYVITNLAATVVEGDLRRTFKRRVMMRRIGAMQDHYIICGFGRVGEEVAREFRERDQPYCIIEAENGPYTDAKRAGLPVILGDAQSEVVLQQAGVERARSVIVVTTSAAVNTYITLTAKHLNPQLYIVARADSTITADKLELAGADRVVSPFAISARRMALSALQPLMTDFMDVLALGRHGEFMVAEVKVEANSPMRGQPLAKVFAAAKETTVLSIRRGEGHMLIGPKGDDILNEGDVAIVLTKQEALDTWMQEP